MPVIKASVRILGLVWVGLLIVFALKLTPQVQATSAPDPKAARSASSQRVETTSPSPVQGAPRVVYQGAVAPSPTPRQAAMAKPVVAPEAVAPAPAPAKPIVVASLAPEGASATTGAVARAEPPREPAAGPQGLVDLNTASLADLNGLKGAGMIGRAIVQGRPYRSTEDLLAKRVLNRAAFARIKDQVAVR